MRRIKCLVMSLIIIFGLCGINSITNAQINDDIFDSKNAGISYYIFGKHLRKISNNKFIFGIKSIRDRHYYDYFGEEYFYGLNIINFYNPFVIISPDIKFYYPFKRKSYYKTFTGVIGVKFKIWKTEHYIKMGRNIQEYFTPYTLKKLNFTGMNYNFNFLDLINLKFLSSTRFRESLYEIPNYGFSNSERDKVFLAARINFIYSELIKGFSESEKNHNIGISFVHNHSK